MVNPLHAVNGNAVVSPFPDGFMHALFGLGCFWGAERKFWQLNGVYSTAVGYAAGVTPNPSYEEVCSGMTGHNEVVLVIYDSSVICYSDLLMTFFESHNPTQGMRQGNDRGTQYRSGIYVYSDEQRELAKIAINHYQAAITQKGFGIITTNCSQQVISSMPKTITNNTYTKILRVIAAWVVQECVFLAS